MYLPHCLYTSIQTNNDVVVAQCVALSMSRRIEKKKKQQQQQQQQKTIGLL